jgi:predicted RNA binding protein YcfA (HicA-like mRNA interferase family)
MPAVAGAKVVRALEKWGWSRTRIRGSHHIMQHPDGRTVAVPVHSNRDIAKGTLRGILKEVGMSVAEFMDLL